MALPFLLAAYGRPRFLYSDQRKNAIGGLQHRQVARSRSDLHIKRARCNISRHIYGASAKHRPQDLRTIIVDHIEKLRIVAGNLKTDIERPTASMSRNQKESTWN